MPKFKDYKQGQQSSLFPLDLSSLVPENHLVRHISSVIDRLDSKVFHSAFSPIGASSYHPQMMLKVIIYGYSTKNYSCRNIAAMLRQDITYMWLSGMQVPDFNTVNRFRSVYLKDILESVFTEVLLLLHEHDFIKFENYFVDGTKLEADAGKYSHVWRKNTERYKLMVQKRVAELLAEIEEFNEQENKLYNNEDLPELGKESDISSNDIEHVAQQITQKLTEKRQELTTKEHRQLKSKLTKLSKEKSKLEKYEEQDSILGARNSYSKTDHDASMMRMKGTDELRPGYNPQVSSENQFVVAVSVGQNASDSVCFPVHLQKIKDRGEQFTPDNYIGDAGYGSDENYDLLEKCQISNYLKYPLFHKEQGAKHKENIFHADNLLYNEGEDYYTCPDQRKLIYKETIERTSINGHKKTIRVYESEDCSNCPMKELCTKSKTNRSIQVNRNLERHRKIARDNLKSEKGVEFRKRRGWEIETFFGDLKHNQKYKRFRLRGLEKVNLEMLWLSICYNLRKSNKLMFISA